MARRVALAACFALVLWATFTSASAGLSSSGSTSMRWDKDTTRLVNYRDSPLTYAIWCYAPNTTDALYVGFSNNYNNGTTVGPYVGITLRGDDADEALLMIWPDTNGGGGAWRAIQTTNTFGVGWHHVVAVFASHTDYSIYLDGDIANRGHGTTNTGTMATNSVMDVMSWGGIHRAAGDAGGVSGLVIGPCAIWNMVPTDAEIEALYAGRSPRTVQPASLLTYVSNLDTDGPDLGVSPLQYTTSNMTKADSKPGLIRGGRR